MGFNLIYWIPISGSYVFLGSIWERRKKEEKTTVFPGGYGQIGERQHGRISPDWGL